MGFLQFCGSAISFFIGFLIFASAKSAIHETLAMTFLIVSAVLFAGGAITECLQNVNKNVKEIAAFLVINSPPKQDVPSSRSAAQSTIGLQKDPLPPEKETFSEMGQPRNAKADSAHKDQPPAVKRVSWVEQAKKEMASETTKT